jgi:hypothetical protein
MILSYIPITATLRFLLRTLKRFGMIIIVRHTRQRGTVPPRMAVIDKLPGKG